MVTAAHFEPETDCSGLMSRLCPASIRISLSISLPKSSAMVTRPKVSALEKLVRVIVLSLIPSNSPVGPIQNQRSPDSPAVETLVD